ncbi:MAG: FadR family transcriptional regulator [Deltaproteobacteria bacterium]|nr:MAG: FadR family transcriptional regulator [Deltaproteobacteria bacterium]
MKKNEGKRGIFSPIKTSKIPDEVYKQIVSMIGSGQLKPGQKLPSEREMASDLGISRQSIREALYRAETIGLIEVRQGEGSFVLSSVGESLSSPLAVLLAEQAERVFEFLEIRKLIEGWCAEKAAVEADAGDLEKMKEILETMKELSTKNRKWEEADMEFHFSVVAATHNVIAMHIMEALKVSFDTFFNFRQLLSKTDNKELMWKHHHEVYRAIKQRNPALARQKIVDHLDFIERKIKEDVEKMQT